jgi:hypothetical protein
MVAALGLALFNLFVLVGQAQFDCATTNGTITTAKHTGPGDALTIPSTINGLPVTGASGAGRSIPAPA